MVVVGNIVSSEISMTLFLLSVSATCPLGGSYLPKALIGPLICIGVHVDHRGVWRSAKL